MVTSVGSNKDGRDGCSRSRRPVNQINAHSLKVVRRHSSVADAAAAVKISRSTMSGAIRDQRLKAGCLWQYADGGAACAAGGRHAPGTGSRVTTPATAPRVKRAQALAAACRSEAQAANFALLPADILGSLIKGVGGASARVCPSARVLCARMDP